MADTLAMHLRSSSRAMFITMFRCGVLVVTLAMGMLPQADGTSSKMDYLALADVRVDPMDEELCVSDHIHTFYGANVRLSPDVSFAEMRVAEGSSGNVEENKSLYWHPTVYEVDVDESGQPIEYRKAPIWFASSYYVWPTGETRSFPQVRFLLYCVENAQIASRCTSPRVKTSQTPFSARNIKDKN